MVVVEPREEADLARCVALLETVHDADGYPVNMPEDPLSFLVVPDALGAWVALAEGDVVGHVLLRPATNPKVMAVASEVTGLPETGLAVVGRLLVTPSARRRGVGAALLARAAGEAWQAGRQPVLDVVTDHSEAIALYKRQGWRLAGSMQVTWANGQTIDELVFVGPSPIVA